MDKDRNPQGKPPAPESKPDLDEGLDEYDEELTESFPASDPPSSAEPGVG